MIFVVDPLVNVLGNSNTFINEAIASDGITYKKLNKTNSEAIITQNNNNLNNANGSCNGTNNVGKSPQKDGIGRGNNINFMSGKKLVKTQIKFNEVRL